MRYSKDNVRNVYPAIVDDKTFESIIDLLNLIDLREAELSELSSKKVELELKLETLRESFKDFRSLVEIIKEPKKDKIEKAIEKVTDNKSPLVFGIISPGEGNTRIGT